LIQPREARQRTETLARRAQRGSPSAGSRRSMSRTNFL
jgi:hypothetical protein